MADRLQLLDQFGRPLRMERKPTAVQGKYDAAQTKDSNYRHWSNADAFSARAANSAGVRSTLRNRARYEADNNGYAQGLIETLSHDCIGTGPRLQLNLADATPEVARKVEREFAKWAADEFVDLADKLRLMDESTTRDGESFAVFVNNPRINHPVKLDLRLIEADQCADIVEPLNMSRAVDGIVFDELGYPVEYHFLVEHPGDNVSPQLVNKIVKIGAEYVIHWFRPRRIGQARGVPAITPALPIFAQLRRYCLATLEAAEVAANLAGVMTTDALPDGSPVDVDPDVPTYDRIPMERGTLLSLPKGYAASQFKPEQPTATFRDFKGENLDEIGRSVHAPSNVIRGNSREYNFSSGRLDYVIYHRAVKIKRFRKRQRALDRILRYWTEEAIRIPGLLPTLPPIELWDWNWHWDGFESIDPVKDAESSKTLLELGLTTYSELLAEDGKDWEEVAAQRQREMQKFAELGLPAPPQPKEAAQPAGGGF